MNKIARKYNENVYDKVLTKMLSMIDTEVLEKIEDKDFIDSLIEGSL